MKKSLRCAKPLVKRMIALSVYSSCYLLTATQASTARDEGTDSDKISSIILAHRQQKIRPDGVTVEEHAERLKTLGLNPDRLDVEEAALYVHERLTPQETAELKQQGIEINPWGWVPAVATHHEHGFHVATVSYDRLDVIRQDDRFIFAESVESVMHPQNLAARVMINADDVSNGSGVTARTGAGVKIAIADSGIDLSHADFPTPIEAFDMTDGTCAPGSCGMNETPWGTSVANTVMDHGTHVAGSALGRGVLGPYQGAADGAGLYFYKIGNDTDASASDTDMIEAINRFVAVSGSGPRIFSMSYGGFNGQYMDGSDPVCQAIDNATAAGVSCFIAAGNEANSNGLYPWAANRHDSMSVAPGVTSATFNFVVINSGNSNASMEDLRVIWRDDVADSSNPNISLSCTNCANDNNPATCLAHELCLQCPGGICSGASSRGTEARQYVLNVPAGQSPTYSLRLQNTAPAGGSTPLVHVYRNGGRGTFNSPDNSYTITYPGVADTAITIGAVVQANGWTDWQNAFWQYTWMYNTSTAGAPFSSIGPRIDGAQKPDIVAPGAVTISTMDSGTFGSPSGCNIFSGFPLNCLRIDNDGFSNGSGPANYYVKFGTSMATPMAAGAAALLLEAAPTMTPAQVKALLAATASNAGSPNNSFGAGMIDILAAIQTTDCDNNGIYDPVDVANADCNGNSLPDPCDIAAGVLADCNNNGIADPCDVSFPDCNSNLAPDDCDITPGPLQFGSAISSSLGSNFLGHMATGLFDGDGDLDVVHQIPDGTVYLVLGNGNGTFAYSGQFNIGGGMSILLAADVDSDGDSDLLAKGGFYQGVTVILCNGNGTFASPVEYAPTVVGSQTFDVAVADIDHDGVLDLAAAEYGWDQSISGVDVFLGNGDGTFASGVGYSLGPEVHAITAGDLDGDGYIDLVAAFAGPGNDDIAVLINNGDGTLASAVMLTVGSNPQRVAIADFDVDGYLDIATANYNDGQTSDNDLSVLFNNGGGTFGPAVHYDIAVKSSDVLAVDFDLDGVADIAVGHRNNYSRVEYSVVLSNGDGTFDSPVYIAPPTQFIGDSVFGDFDNDADPDWAVHEAGVVSVLPNTTVTPAEPDCNVNGTPDSCDIASGASADCQTDGFPDECQLAGNDCNANSAPDDCDISSGSSSDTNSNGLPDECEAQPCVGDLNGDGTVNASDLALLLGAWGSNPGHVADLNGDGVVNASDLALLLGNWGLCP